jgi:pyridoxine 4-dehydrogenase
VCEEEGMVFSPWHPLSVYEGANRDQVKEVIGPMARRHDVTDSQIALAWQLYHSPVSLPIPGTTSVAHLSENLAAQNIRLDPDEVTAITGLVPEQSP